MGARLGDVMHLGASHLYNLLGAPGARRTCQSNFGDFNDARQRLSYHLTLLARAVGE
jgi:hypothetical protein